MHPLIFDFGRLQFGPLDIPVRLPSYGAAMLLGMVLGWWIIRRLGRRVAPEEPWLDLYAGMLLAGLVGAKLLFAVIELPALLAGELAWRQVLLAGGVWLGGVLGGLVFCRHYFRRSELSAGVGLNVLFTALPALLAGELAWRQVLLAGGVWLGGVLGGLVFCRHYFRRSELSAGVGLNVLFTALPLSHAIGRIGCFLAGCCYGSACSLPWAVTYSSPVAATYAGTPLGVALHPSPLYEATLEIVNFAICRSLWRRRVPPPWLVVFTWMGLYGVGRFALEFLRGDPRGAWSGLSTSQWGSAVMVLAAVVFFVRRRASGGPRSAD